MNGSGFAALADAIYELIGAKIREKRELVGMTQETLAGHVGLSRASVANIERGRQAIYVHQLLHFGKALGISPSSLLVSTSQNAKAQASVEHPLEFQMLLKKLNAEEGL